MSFATGYPFWQFYFHKWSYQGKSSWRHGSAYLPWVKITW